MEKTNIRDILMVNDNQAILVADDSIVLMDTQELSFQKTMNLQTSAIKGCLAFEGLVIQSNETRLDLYQLDN